MQKSTRRGFAQKLVGLLTIGSVAEILPKARAKVQEPVYPKGVWDNCDMYRVGGELMGWTHARPSSPLFIATAYGKMLSRSVKKTRDDFSSNDEARAWVERVTAKIRYEGRMVVD